MPHGPTSGRLTAKVARIMDGSRRGAWPAILSLAAVVLTAGCQRLFVLPAPEYHSREIEQRHCRPTRSDSTSSLLKHRQLEDLAWSTPRDAFSLLEQDAGIHPLEPAYLLALAELAGEIAQTAPFCSTEAVLWSRDAAVYAVFCLAQLNEADTTMWCAAQTVHNNAVAYLLQLMQTSTKSNHEIWPAWLACAGIVPASPVPLWTAMGFNTLQPIDAWRIGGAGRCTNRPGLGVPVIAQRRLEDTELARWKPFGPRDAVFAVTAVIQPRGPLATWRDEPVELVLHDPANEERFEFAGKWLPLAMNLTTPLIHRLKQMRNYELRGVVDADSYVAQAGAYALDPYQPGKIPIVLVEGLWSSPTAWISMLDSLRGDPFLRASYQFWVVLYPSGYPLPVAALSLRRSLREIRERFDPQGTDPASTRW